MRKRLPPLFSLQVFEAAARHGKFSLAAEELALTQSAISRQIKQLEDWCGHALFTRHGPRIELSLEGRALLDRLSGPLNALHGAFYADSAEGQQHLHINTLASIAESLLLPHLHELRSTHPDLNLCIQADYTLHTLPPQLPMVAIRYTTQAHPELYSQRILDDYLIVVGTPALVQQIGTDAQRWPSSLLMRHSYMDWSAWASDPAISTKMAPLSSFMAADGIEFNDALLLLNAAKRGLGLSLTRLSLAAHALKSGELALASPHICVSPLSFYLEYRHDCAVLPAIQIFTKWLTAVAEHWRTDQENLLFQLTTPITATKSLRKQVKKRTS